MAHSIAEVFQGLKIGEIERIIHQKIQEGANPYFLIKECQDEMARIGKKFESGEYFLGELIISAKMFEKVVQLLSPELKGDVKKSHNAIGKIVLGTPKGDIHDLGKNIFALLARVAEFDVVDIGIDVPPEKFLDRVRQEKPDIVGMSGLITTVYPSMKEVVDLLRQQGLRDNVKIIIGGGATGEEARRFVGADAQTLDATEGVRICQKFLAPLTLGERK
jgi:methylmalonyl-CoA mutase cobalamin-binding domain/chain